jgi:dipeptidase D
MADITTLEPKKLWHFFAELCKIPHGSGNEEGIRKFLIKFADERGLKYKRDTVGNVVIYKEASNGFKSAKPLIYQAHMDMVCESDPKIGWDPLKDPVKPRIDGDWVVATGTTLGSDNGMGMAAMLAVCDDKSLKHGPVECLFTTTEETGLDGAFGLQNDMLNGRTMVNLDSEDERIIFVGCAGGCETTVNIPLSRKALPKEHIGLQITISGLKGGHSGLMINEQRGNAIKLIARVLYGLHRRYHILLCDINGGTRRNVIPNLATATIALKRTARAKIVGYIEELKRNITDELRIIDPDFKLELKDVPVTESLNHKLSDKILCYLHSQPHGVITMSYDIPGLVQTSTNLAIVHTNNDFVTVAALSRSSSATEIEAVKDRLAAHAELIGIEVEESGGYPGWQPNLSSHILKLTKKIFNEMFGAEPKHAAIHAGLECGIIGEKFPGMDMISFGPEIKGAHSINEKVHIKSAGEFYNALVKIAENFAKEGA